MKILTALLVMLTFCVAATGQNTTFTYQGRLTDQSVAANGQYSFEFKLFDTQTPARARRQAQPSRAKTSR
jgi:hypothetical protein